MPRSPRGRAAVECAAHGMQCALAGRGTYRSGRCAPAVAPLPQEASLRALLDGIARQELAERAGITLEQAGRQLEAERAAARRRPPAVVDAEWHGMIAAATAESEAEEARIVAGDHR